MTKKQVRVTLQTGEVVELEVENATAQGAVLAAKARAQYALKRGVFRNIDGLRLYPPHMIKHIDIV